LGRVWSAPRPRPTCFNSFRTCRRTVRSNADVTRAYLSGRCKLASPCPLCSLLCETRCLPAGHGDLRYPGYALKCSSVRLPRRLESTQSRRQRMPVKRLLRKFSSLLLSRSETALAKSISFPPRKHPRVALATDVKVDGYDVSFTVRSVQLGTRGMCLKRADQLSLAQPVQLTFALPSGCLLRVGAVVWWKRDDLTGLRFDPRDNYRAIEEWIEMENGANSALCDPRESRRASATCVAQKP